MKKSSLATGLSAVAIAAALAAPLAVQAQNVTLVNGKPVPKSRVDALMGMATRAGQPRTPELEKQVRDEVVLREIFVQEAERRGLAATPEYKQQMELARQSVLFRQLLADEEKRRPITDAQIQAEYERVKASRSGTEYRARHILVEKEEDAKALITQLKGGAKFEDLAKANSKDPGSKDNGGDLDFANPGNYVPEFGAALTKLKKGEITETPVKTQFGYHIIKLEDTRQPQFPSLEEVKPQIQQALQQQRVAEFRDQLRKKAKTDYKFD